MVPSRRLSLSLVALIRRPQARHVSFSRLPSTSPLSFARPAFWLFPLVGGISLFFYPRPQPILSQLFSSPTLIPCTSKEPETSRGPLILSPSERNLSLSQRISSLFLDHIWEPILTARRFIHLFFLFVPVILSSPMLLVGVPEERLLGDKWGAVWWYNYLVTQMDRAGPTFIKVCTSYFSFSFDLPTAHCQLAQWAASRADLFPTLLCERMGKLHSQGRSHALAHTKRVIERVFQRPFEEVFEEFDETPIGSGAIAQVCYTFSFPTFDSSVFEVYRATMKQDLLPPSYFDPKRTQKKGPGALAPVILPESKPSVPTAAVAIKVLHPRVAKLIERDLTIMSFFAHLITLFPGMQWVSLPEEVEVFGRMMYEQLDLRKEADNLVTFERNFMTRKSPVTFPRPLQIWSTTDLLVEEHQTAVPLELFVKNGGGPYDDQLAELGLDAFLVSDIGCYWSLLIGRSIRTCYFWITSFIPTSIRGTSWSSFPGPQLHSCSKRFGLLSSPTIRRTYPTIQRVWSQMPSFQISNRCHLPPSLGRTSFSLFFMMATSRNSSSLMLALSRH